MQTWNINRFWIKLNNDIDDPDKWLKQGYIEFKERLENNSLNFNWLENQKSRWYFTTKLKPGGTIYIYIVSSKQCLLKYKIIVDSKYIHKFHGYKIREAYKCLDTIHLLDWRDGSHKNGQTVYAAKGGEKLKKCINPNIHWNLIKNFTSQQVNSYDQETMDCRDEQILNHIENEGKLIQRPTFTRGRSLKLRDAYLEIYGYSCKLCGKSYLKSDGISYIIDVHHLKPIASGERETDIHRDLKGLCPNCHRFVHSIRDFENKSWDKIKEIFKR